MLRVCLQPIVFPDHRPLSPLGPSSSEVFFVRFHFVLFPLGVFFFFYIYRSPWLLFSSEGTSLASRTAGGKEEAAAECVQVSIGDDERSSDNDLDEASGMSFRPGVHR